MSNVHIFTARTQPATRFKVDFVGAHWIRHKQRAPVFTDCCLSWRWAKHCRVQVYYDGIRYWCKLGHGCKA